MAWLWGAEHGDGEAGSASLGCALPPETKGKDVVFAMASICVCALTLLFILNELKMLFNFKGSCLKSCLYVFICMVN